MTIEQIQAKIRSADYDFLFKEPRLGDNIMFLTVAGSHAYGTNVETSDLDIAAAPSTVEATSSACQISSSSSITRQTRRSTALISWSICS